MIAHEDLLRIKRIASRANPRIKDWAGLANRKDRERLGLTMAEGSKLTREGLNMPAHGRFAPVALLISDSGSQHREAASLFALAGELAVDRLSLTDDCFDKISGMKNSDGIALIVSYAPEKNGLASLWRQADARWLVAAGVQDPGNAGALARTALAANCTGCLFLDGADPLSPKFLRGSMGAAFRIPCLSGSILEFAEVWRKNSGRVVMAAAEGAAQCYREIDYRPPVAILVGGERGIPEVLASLADCRAHIPLHGAVESLNLAVAAGIILFEAEKHWRPVDASDAASAETTSPA